MDPLPLVVCGAAAALYALGRRGRTRTWREVSFYSGVVLTFIVLERPFDGWADTWLSAHMSQHIVLMTVVPPPPVRARIDHLHRSIWFAAAMVPSWILAIVLAFATAPVYAAYPSLTDQQIAAGVMWVPGSLTYFIAASVFFYRWLDAPPEPRPE